MSINHWPSMAMNDSSGWLLLSAEPTIGVKTTIEITKRPYLVRRGSHGKLIGGGFFL